MLKTFQGFYQRLRLLLSLCFLGFFVFSCHAQNPLTIQDVRSPKGITAWLVEDHSLPVISIHFSFKAGSAYIDPRQAGLGDLVAHMLDEGAGPYTSRQFNELLQNLAINFSCTCDTDHFTFSLRTTTEHQKKAFELLKFVLTNPRFEPAQFKKVQAGLLASLQVQKKTPPYILQQAFLNIVMGSHPYAVLPSGTEESLQKLTPQDLKDFVRRAFAKDNLTISVCGDITPENLKTLLDQTFQDLPDHSRLPDLPPLSFPKKGGVHFIPADFAQSVALFAQEGLNPASDAYVLAVLVNKILGDSSWSRLFLKIRVEQGNVYSISTFFNHYKNISLFLVDLASANDRIKASLDMVQKIWRDIKDHPITQEELEEAKDHVIGSFALNLLSSAKIAQLIHHYQRWGYPLDYPQVREAKIKAITLEQINAFAQDFLDPENLICVVVGRQDNPSSSVGPRKISSPPQPSIKE